jgi:hypothetical protein
VAGASVHLRSLRRDDVDSLELTDEDDDEMTDGQLAEYIAGTQGGALCTTCGSASRGTFSGSLEPFSIADPAGVVDASTLLGPRVGVYHF